jgi:dihydrodipicolinate synthase/N-acetylneuraminate lyase
MMRRRRGPGLLRTAGRTAVIAGTATAVSGKVAEAQHARQAEAAAAAAVPPEAPPPQEPQQAKPTTSEQLDQLERLAALHQQGVLDDAELAEAKAKILASL